MKNNRPKNSMKVKQAGVVYPMKVLVEAALMANGELLHYGKTLGYINDRQLEMIESGATKLTRGNEVVVALGENVA